MDSRFSVMDNGHTKMSEFLGDIKRYATIIHSSNHYILFHWTPHLNPGDEVAYYILLKEGPEGSESFTERQLNLFSKIEVQKIEEADFPELHMLRLWCTKKKLKIVCSVLPEFEGTFWSV